VDDVAKGFIGTMGNEKCVGEAYNITGEEWMTWTRYHQIVAEVAGGTLDPCYIPTDTLVQVAPKLSGGTKEIFAWPSIFDNSKIKRDTDYPGQTILFREGVARNIAWMDERNLHELGNEADVFEDRLIDAWRSGVLSALPKEA
jgi:nucleoside-diphosphate-sugar epimerase